jgi:hypothetical protein
MCRRPLNRLFLTFQVRGRQEHDLKVRNFLPPQAPEPEIFLVDGKSDAERRLQNGDTKPEGKVAVKS